MVHVESVGGRCTGVPGASESQRLRWADKPPTVKNRDRAGPILGLAEAGMHPYILPNKPLISTSRRTAARGVQHAYPIFGSLSPLPSL